MFFLEAGQIYGLIARSKDSDFFQVRVPGSKKKNRWVGSDCGSAHITYDAEASIKVQRDTIENTLAASWQPSFCSTKRGETNKGCTTLQSGEPATRQFSLHGLWPDDLNTLAIFPCNCHLPKGPTSCWKNSGTNEPIDISDELEKRLSEKMPGSRGDLENHEWTKHGTCYEQFITGPDAGSDDDEYFEDSLLVLDQLNASPIQKLFEDRIGEQLTALEIMTAFDEAFGQGAGDRVQVVCEKSADGTVTMIEQLYIGLSGTIEANSDLSQLILAAPPLEEATREKPCQSGLVARWP